MENSGFEPLPETGAGTTGPSGGTRGKIDLVTAHLQDLTKFVSTFGPLVGSSILAGKMMIALLKSNGVDVAEFEVEIARLEGELQGLQADINAFAEIVARRAAADHE